MNPLRLPPSSLIADLSDEHLETRIQRLVGVERGALALLLAHLAEFDARRLYADRGYPSLFAYCMRVLGYSEQGAYKRIQAARAVRTHPALLQRLADGEIHLAAIVVLAPHLRGENIEVKLAAARGKSVRELEVMAAAWSPRPDAPDVLRALPAPVVPVSERAIVVDACRFIEAPLPATSSLERESRPAVVPVRPREELEPLSADRFLFRFTADAGVRADYMRARDLLSIKPASGPMEAVFQAALGALLDRIDPQRRHNRRQETSRRKARRRNSPTDERGRSRHILRALRDAVWARDGGRCTFMGPAGQRCAATRYLEIDHVRPYALGGRSDDLENLRLACRAHNQLLARRIFGETACRETIHVDSAKSASAKKE